ncbi:Survival motor neuron 1 protein [Rutstroemia sp. NJR-2017a BBW]|nr:Survival motor neuron 1 protein [Rutstroemia sp. NJR-2017a BBW]
MASQENATHAEIWDDSTLVNSWNEALQEYERYHSIHARGEKVEDVLKDFDEQESNEVEPIETEINENEMVVEGAIKEEPNLQRESWQADDNADVLETDPQVDNQATVEATTSQTRESKAPALPPMLVGQGETAKIGAR